MASMSVEAPGKRKRSPSHAQQQLPISQASNGFTQINYLVPGNKRLKLIEGDSDTFKEVLGMIDDYESVLQRHESLAANMGAKLVGPLLLKSFDKLFDGEIRITTPSFALEQSKPTWLELVNHARSSLSDFVIGEDGYCQVFLRGGQVQISEDDYRLIMSGAPERMIPNQHLPEDEAAELATLNILESRLAVLIQKADVVASKARQLNYHLGKHKATIQARSSSSNGKGIPPVNYSHVQIQQDLLKQFSQDGRQSPRPARVQPNYQITDGRRSMSTMPNRRDSPAPKDDYRALVAATVEKLAKGDPIDPPCDRCRRLHFDCTKNLTACTACTKKHAKCSWTDISEEELAAVQSGKSTLVSGSSSLNPLIAATEALDAGALRAQFQS